MKRSVKICSLALLAAPLLNGCSGHSAQEKYYLVSANINLPYWQAAGAGFSQAATELGVKGLMVGPSTYDPQAEVKDFRATVDKKPAGILVSAADSKLMAPEIDAAIAAGIPVITMDSDSPDSKRLYFIGTNNLQAGMLGGQELVRRLNGKGNVVFFTMPGQVNMDERLKGYMDVLSTHTGIRVVDTIDIRGDSRVAFDKTSEYVTKTGNDKVDAYVCLEASSGKDVAEALKRGNAKAVILAMDTDDATLKLVQDGTIAATVSQKPWSMAYLGLQGLAAVEAAKPANKHLGQKFDNDPHAIYPNFVDTGTTLVTQENAGQFSSSASQ